MDKIDKKTRWRAAIDIGRLFFAGRADAVEDWTSQDAGYQTEFLAMAHLLADMEGLADDPDILQQGHKPVAVPWRERMHQHWPKLAAAASLMVATLIGLLHFWFPETPADIQVLSYVTRVGEQKTVSLEDGSEVVLNTGTKLLVKLAAAERKIILEQGEAWFKVAPDPQRPFTVDAGFRSVTALGTAFSVNKQPDKLQVVVAEGVVSMHAAEESPLQVAPLLGKEIHRAEQGDKSSITGQRQYRIAAGWVAEFDADKQKIHGYSPKNIDAVLSWRSGVLDFPGTPLVKVVQELNRYSGKKILIEDVDIIDLKVLAVFKIDRLDLALDGLEYTLPIKVTHHFDRIVLTRAE